MTQHSPGPWDYNGPPHNMHVVQAAEPHMRVCFLTSDGPTAANARLIAAAPEMLEALKRAVARADQNLKNFRGRTLETQADYEFCVAAIRKATGADEA